MFVGGGGESTHSSDKTFEKRTVVEGAKEQPTEELGRPAQSKPRVECTKSRPCLLAPANRCKLVSAPTKIVNLYVYVSASHTWSLRWRLHKLKNKITPGMTMQDTFYHYVKRVHTGRAEQ